MPITVYWTPGSPPCNLVLLTAKALDLDIEWKTVDTMKNQHLEPEYLKINPQHTVPTLVDGDFSLWESRAIARYLASKHGSPLYPQDLKTRAVVEQRLDFDLGTLGSRYAEYYYPQIRGQKADEEKLEKLKQALSFLNTFLEGSQYVAGADLTIADFAIVVTVACINAWGMDLNPYPNIVRWFELVKSTVPAYQEAVEDNVNKLMAFIEGIRNGTIKRN